VSYLSLGDLGNARDRGVIDTRLCTLCRHGYRRLGEIDCRHQPWADETPAVVQS
jgi:hypothetical protein